MDVQFVDASMLDSLDQYAVSLVTAVMTLKTLESYQKEAIKKGLLEEDEFETASTIVWELHRLASLYQTQADNVFERLPEDFNVGNIVESLQRQSIEKAKTMIKRPKNDTKTENNL